MDVTPLPIKGAFYIQPNRLGDERGWFSEVYRAETLNELGSATRFVQENQAYSAEPGIVRGLHWQEPPHAQAKLISVLDGEIFDVIVDLRRRSPTYGQHYCTTLSARQGDQLLAPRGVAHGYCALSPDCRVSYKVDNYYAPESERGLLWNDPALDIPWPVTRTEAVLSYRDKIWPVFDQLNTSFD